MNKVLVLIVATILGALVCIGCVYDEVKNVPPFEEETNTQEEDITIVYRQPVSGHTTDIRILHDNKRNVTCWELVGGMSCVPDHLIYGDMHTP